MPNASIIPRALDEKLSALPPELKEALGKIPLSEVVYEIGKSNSLQIDEVGTLGEIVGEFILGYIDPPEFASEIRERTGVDSEKGGRIAREINTKIFLPIRESLRRTIGAKTAQAVPVKPPPLPIPVKPLPPAVAPKPPQPPYATGSRPQLIQPPKPIAQKPPVSPTPPAAERKPEPMIIRPLPMPPPIGPIVRKQESMSPEGEPSVLNGARSEQEAAMGIRKVEASPAAPPLTARSGKETVSNEQEMKTPAPLRTNEQQPMSSEQGAAKPQTAPQPSAG